MSAAPASIDSPAAHRRFPLLALAIVATLVIATGPARAAMLRVPGDHASIQSGIDAASDGDTVLVSPGTYHERLTMKPGVTVKSEGDDTPGKIGLKRAEQTIIDGSKGDVMRPGVAMAGRAVLDGFTVTGVGAYDDAKWNKHHATQGSEQSHEHIGEAGTPGIEVTGVTCTVAHNIVHHVGYTGIAITGVEGKRTSPQILSNVCYRNMGGGIGSMKQSTAIIEGNTCFQNFYAGIGHDDASPVVIANTCYENIRAGIGISEGAKPLVRGNKCYRNRRAGIGVRTGADTQPIIEDNDCYENDMAGIGSSEHARPIIRNNRCYRNKLTGIGAQSGAHPIIVANECYENEMSGIGQRDDTETIIVSNHSHHNKTSGIGFDSGGAGKAIVAGNRVVDNARVAVGVNDGWDVQLIGNELSRQGGMPPIVMVASEARASLTDNTITGGGVAGVRVAGTALARGNRFVGTDLRKVGPPSFAVWGLPGSVIEFSDNEVAGWRHAISADGAAVTAWRNRVADYWQVGIRVSDPTSPVHAFDNVFRSEHNHPALKIEGQSGYVEGNRVEPTDRP